MARIELQQVAKRYGTHTVIPGLDLAIEDGEFMVLVGPSGCGKSTLLRMIAGLEAISEGELRLDGQRVNEVDAADRGAAMVFQSYALYPHMTVAENMGFALRMSGRSKAERQALVAETAEKLQLTPLLGRYPKELSGGQRQRVAIGRAIVRRPKVFLFDEPLSNLDAALRVQMRIELARLHAELGTTMVYVTHDQTEAMTLGQRIAVLNQGRIEQVGTPMSLYQSPANRFVAGFLGSPRINLLPYRWDAASACLRLPGDSTVDAKALGLDPALLAQGEQIGWRPEDLAVASPHEGLRGELGFVELLGDVCVLHIRLAACDTVITVKQTMAPQSLRVGDAVGVQPQSRGLLFAADGQRVGG